MILNRIFNTVLTTTVLILVFTTIIQYSSASTYESCTVTDKDRVSDMRIYSSCGVFQVQNMSLNLEFNSSELFGSIEEGKTYNFDTTSKRIPFLSMFPIIRNASEV